MVEDVALSQARDFALLDELAERLDQALIAYLKMGSEAFGSEGLGRLAEQGEDLFAKRVTAGGGLRGMDCGCQFQVWTRFGVRQLQSQRLRG